MLEQIERLFQIKSELGIYVGKRGYFLHFFLIFGLGMVYVCGGPG